MNYALKVGLLEEQVAGVYEGDKDRPINYRNLMRTIATLYDVEPSVMVKFWPNVDMVFLKMGQKLVSSGVARQVGSIIIN